MLRHSSAARTPYVDCAKTPASKTNATALKIDLYSGMPALLKRCTKHAIRSSMVGADWRLRLGLQYVANSASTQCHNGSEVCACVVADARLRGFFIAHLSEVSRVYDLRRLDGHENRVLSRKSFRQDRSPTPPGGSFTGSCRPIQQNRRLTSQRRLSAAARQVCRSQA